MYLRLGEQDYDHFDKASLINKALYALACTVLVGGVWLLIHGRDTRTTHEVSGTLSHARVETCQQNTKQCLAFYVRQSGGTVRRFEFDRAVRCGVPTMETTSGPIRIRYQTYAGKNEWPVEIRLRSTVQYSQAQSAADFRAFMRQSDMFLGAIWLLGLVMSAASKQRFTLWRI